MAKEKLEVEVQTCRHLEMEVPKREDNNMIRINLGRKNGRKINIGNIIGIDKKESICELTKQPCVLYNPQYYRSSYIPFVLMDKCPAFEQFSGKYIIEGKKDRHNFYAKRMIKVIEGLGACGLPDEIRREI